MNRSERPQRVSPFLITYTVGSCWLAANEIPHESRVAATVIVTAENFDIFISTSSFFYLRLSCSFACNAASLCGYFSIRARRVRSPFSGLLSLYQESPALSIASEPLFSEGLDSRTFSNEATASL